MDERRDLPEPGPSDPSVLYLQHQHRSTAIWDSHDLPTLHCRRIEASLRRVVRVLDTRVLRCLMRAGFYGLYRLGFMALDWSLITALVERWRVETHTFHLPVGEATITLQDVSLLLGLPIDGGAVTSQEVQKPIPEWQQLCRDLLGIAPPDSAFDGSRLRLSALTHHLSQPIPNDADQRFIEAYSRTYILVQLGGCLFADKSSSKVKLMFLPLLRDLDAAGRLSWGSAALACLYRELCLATRAEASSIAGPLVLLQLWAWERLRHVRLERRDVHPRAPSPPIAAGLPGAPLGCRWDVPHYHKDTPAHSLRHYRDQLDQMRPEHMIWEPYTADVMQSLPDYCLRGQAIWGARVPLIYFAVVEWHFPDRVLRQFGVVQGIPASCDSSQELHRIDMRGRHGCDWSDHHRAYIGQWDHRLDHVVFGDGSDRATDQCTDDYMPWYTGITRRLIGPVIQMPAVGFQPVGSIRHLLEDTMTRISQISIIPDIGDTVHQDLFHLVRHIHAMSTACLAAVDDDRRVRDGEGQQYAHSAPSASHHTQPQSQEPEDTSFHHSMSTPVADHGIASHHSSPIPDPFSSYYIMEPDSVHVGGDDWVEEPVGDVPVPEPAQHGMETQCLTQAADMEVQPEMQDGRSDVIVYKRRRTARARPREHGRGHWHTQIDEGSSQLTQATFQPPQSRPVRQKKKPTCGT